MGNLYTRSRDDTNNHDLDAEIMRQLRKRMKHRERLGVGYTDGYMVPMWTRVVPTRGTLLCCTVQAVSNLVVNGTIDYLQFKSLPVDLVQIVLDHILLMEKLTPQTAAFFRGINFLELFLCQYQIPRGFSESLIEFMFPNTLEKLILTQVAGMDDYVLSHLPFLPRLVTFSLDGCDHVSDASLTALVRMPNLKFLCIKSCFHITCVGFQFISGLKNLEILCLESCTRIQGGSSFGSLTNLRKLNLKYCLRISNEDARYISQLSKLEELNIRCTRIDSDGVLYLGCLHNLRQLDLSSLALSDGSVAHVLKRFSGIENLNISRCSHVGQKVLDVIGQGYMPNLKNLNLAYTQASNAALCNCAPHMHRLESIDLESCLLLSDRGISSLSEMKNLREINLSETSMTNSSLEQLSSLPFLERLDISFTKVDDHGLRWLSRSGNMRFLNLDSSNISDEGMLYISQLKHLKWLNLFGCQVGDIGCRYLSRLNQLKYLAICGGCVTSNGVDYISKIASLKVLSLANNHKVTDAAIPALLQLESLVSLNISQCRISSKTLLLLGKLQNLRELTIEISSGELQSLQLLADINKNLAIKGLQDI